ncbi:hypothetical protein KQX54_016983 [Cotesia glomerata]|uniref:Uncharacterized protein n=1 Tax=Cotesia glomerata TaxID=32391 RepID=A0AAV7HSA7_COTGL|nr:hypothetical protein KQX54_016983 [Cotesia glomerata]
MLAKICSVAEAAHEPRDSYRVVAGTSTGGASAQGGEGTLQVVGGGGFLNVKKCWRTVAALADRNAVSWRGVWRERRGDPGGT